jgi:two-component system response regulator AtoC
MSAILLVEHDPTVRRALADLLTASGHRVDSVATAGEAVHRLAGADLLILDMDGPRESSFAAFDQVRAARPDIPVVATASATWHGWKTLSTAMRLGTDDFLTKPFDDDEVSLTIRGALVRGHLIAEAEAAA